MDFLAIWEIIEENIVTILACIGTVLTVILKPQASQEKLAAKEKAKKEKRLAKLKNEQKQLVASAAANAKEQSILEQELEKNA